MQHPLSRVSRGLLVVTSLVMTVACGGNTSSSVHLQPSSVPLENGIIDGTRSTAKDYPATGVLLFTSERDDGSEFGSMLCSGTLIAPDVVMVAGHCNLALFVDNTEAIKYYFSLSLDVSHFGEDDNLELPPHTTAVAGMVPHPDFSLYRVGPGLNETNDIALLYLEEPVTEVKPASLIRTSESKRLKEGAEVAIVGYGRRHNERRRGSDAGIKYHGLTSINEMGSHEMQISPGSPDPHKCHGDSGGPTYMKIGKRLALVGITSHAYDNDDCLHGGVDTRVDKYLGWVKKTLKTACDSGARPACDSSYELDEN